MKRTGWVVGGVILLALGVIALRQIERSARATENALRSAREIAEKCSAALNFTPEIRVNQTVVVKETTPVLELATIEQKRLVRRTWSSTQLYSTKTLEVEATFTARAGFDLSGADPLQIDINARTQQIVVRLPRAKILSVGMGDLHQVSEEGLWNWLQNEERDQVIHDLEAQARQEFATSAILSEAQAEGEKRIRQLLSEWGQISFATPVLPAKL